MTSEIHQNKSCYQLGISYGVLKFFGTFTLNGSRMHDECQFGTSIIIRHSVLYKIKVYNTDTPKGVVHNVTWIINRL